MTLVIVRNGCSSIGGEGVNRDMVRENKCDWCRPDLFIPDFPVGYGSLVPCYQQPGSFMAQLLKGDPEVILTATITGTQEPGSMPSVSHKSVQKLMRQAMVSLEFH
jgi:hypothetical protein